MNIFSGVENGEMFFPVAPSVVFQATLTSVSKKFKVKRSDDFTMSIRFSSGASAFTWGENFDAQVVPAEGGATLRIRASGKVPAQIAQSTRSNKLLTQLFDDVTNILRAQR
jgi:hypothetical protein